MWGNRRGKMGYEEEAGHWKITISRKRQWHHIGPGSWVETCDVKDPPLKGRWQGPGHWPPGHIPSLFSVSCCFVRKKMADCNGNHEDTLDGSKKNFMLMEKPNQTIFLQLKMLQRKEQTTYMPHSPCFVLDYLLLFLSLSSSIGGKYLRLSLCFLWHWPTLTSHLGVDMQL